ncbi:MAG: polysaccharide biosynthesis tyrosine autokinase [Scytonematopsis contorta HA4267-MV1]|nr:polysaccharide biosynthesis tyrosine autokinase [Scytonematopsis contorta HA4267-MV1]
MIQTSLNPSFNPVVAEPEPGYGQLFGILLRRLPWLIGVLVLSVAVAGLITQRAKPIYRSSMQLLVEPNYQVRKDGAAQTEQQQFTDYTVEIDTATQLNLMLSSKLLQQAVDKLKLNPKYKNITVEEIKQSLVVTQVKVKDDNNLRTKIFSVDYTSSDPKQTQEILRAIREVYIDYNKTQQDDRLKKGLRVIREQLRKVSDEVNTADSNLLRFRKVNNLTDPDAQVKELEQQLSAVVQERRATRAQYEEAVARYKSLQQQLKSTPQNALVEARLSQNTRYQGLLNEIQKTELALAQERLRFTDETPSVKKLLEQLTSQKDLLQQEQRRTLGGEAANTSSEQTLQQGQKSQIDLTLSSQLVETQTNILAFAARDQVLAQKETEARTDLKRFPALLAEYSRLQPQVQLTRDRLQQLLKAEVVLRQELSKGGFEWQIVEDPQLGTFMGPHMKNNMLLGAVVGLMLGGIAAFVREASDDAVRTTAELEKQVALPLLGTTPKLPHSRSKDSAIKLPFGKPEVLAPWTVQVMQSSPRWESLDLIFKNIELLNNVGNLKSLMITSALPDDSKSSLALGLAMSAARLHKRVLLIDANLREPALHRQLNLPNEQGLSTLLAGDAPLPNQISVQSSSSSYIDILTAGPQPSDPANLLSSPRMEQLMAGFEENYDLVILDAPPVLGMVDAMLAASSCRSVVMLASIHKVTRTQLSQATAMMSKLNLIGVVANGVSNSESTYIPYARQQRLALQEAVDK